MPVLDTSKEQRYEDLVNAVSGGELTMVKFLWNLVTEIEGLTSETPRAIVEKRAREVDALLKKLKDNPPKNGKTPTREELLALIRPLIPKPIKGDNGKTPTRAELLELIESLMPEPTPAPKKTSKKELIALIKPLIPKPRSARIPKHEWNGTFIRFENPDGTWGEWKNVQGSPGVANPGSGSSGGLERVRAQGFLREGVSEIYFGDNITVTRTGNGVRIDAENGGSSTSGGLDFETPVGDIDDSNLEFTVTETPLYLVVNGAQYFEGVHYTLASLVVSLLKPVGTGGFIRSAYGTGITVATPVGTVDDTNLTFTVTSEPKYVVINGAQHFDGAGYTYTPGQIDLTSPVGEDGFIRYVY